METGDLIGEVYTAYRGKGASKTPAFGTEKSNTALGIANRKIKEWARDSNVSWTSNFKNDLTAINQTGTVATTGTTALTGTGTFFTDYTVGDTITVSGETVRTIDAITSDTALTVSAAFDNTDSGLTFTRRPIIKVSTQDYSLHRKFYLQSDTATVSITSQDLIFNFSTPQARSNIEADVYVSGNNPQILTFKTTIASGNQAIGGTLKVPGFFIPDALVNETDLVPVDNPEWLVYVTAAEIARNDPAKDDQFATLLGIANDLYTKMVLANRKLGFLQGGRVSNNMPQISPQADVDWTL